MRNVRDATIEEVDNEVLNYLENFKKVAEEPFSRLSFYGVKANDIIKYLKNNSVSEKWGEEFIEKIWAAVDRIYENKIIEMPHIQNATETDNFMAKMLIYRGSFILGRSNYFLEPVAITHVVKYLQRDKEIYTWNADFVKNVQIECARAKEYLTGEKSEWSDYFDNLKESSCF